MNDVYTWWFLAVGIAIGAGALWLLLGRLPRDESDIAPEERAEEAQAISRTIEQWGGVAPVELVEQVLELHRSYLVEGVADEPATDQPAPGEEPAVETEPAVEPRPRMVVTAETAEPAAPAVADQPTSRRRRSALDRSRLGLRDASPMQRHDASREAPEADVGQAG